MKLISAGPLLSLSLLSAAVCAGGLMFSLRTPVDLGEAPGYPQALAHLRVVEPDWLLVWPPWAHPTLQHLPHGFTAADALPPSRARLRRIAMLSAPGTAIPPELQDAPQHERRSFEGVEVHVLTYPADPAELFDLVASLGSVSVSLRAAQGTILCDEPRAEGGVQCRGQPAWNYVGPTTLRVDGAEWLGVWAHPVQHKDLVLDLGEQPLGDRIELQAALSDGAALTQGGAPVSIQLDVVGSDARNQLSRTLVRDNRAGVSTLTLPLPVRGDRGHITLRVRTDRDARRHLAINLRVLAAPESP